MTCVLFEKDVDVRFIIRDTVDNARRKLKKSRVHVVLQPQIHAESSHLDVQHNDLFSRLNRTRLKSPRAQDIRDFIWEDRTSQRVDRQTVVVSTFTQTMQSLWQTTSLYSDNIQCGRLERPSTRLW